MSCSSQPLLPFLFPCGHGAERGNRHKANPPPLSARACKPSSISQFRKTAYRYSYSTPLQAIFHSIKSPNCSFWTHKCNGMPPFHLRSKLMSIWAFFSRNFCCFDNFFSLNLLRKSARITQRGSPKGPSRRSYVPALSRVAIQPVRPGRAYGDQPASQPSAYLMAAYSSPMSPAAYSGMLFTPPSKPKFFADTFTA